MDSRITEITTGFERLLSVSSSSFLGTIEVDKADTADVKDLNGTLFPDVRKIATKGTKGFIPALPKGSFVIVSRISGSDDLFISMMSEISGVNLIVNGNIVINEGKNHGLVKIVELTEKLNGLTDKVNDFITKYNFHTHITTATVGTGPVGIIDPTESKETPAAAFKKSDYENAKIKH